MDVEGRHYRTIWVEGKTVKIIDQTKLPHEFVIETLKTLDDAAVAIKGMHVRGAGLIGITAAYGMYLASLQGISIEKAAEKLMSTRPTAVNLKNAVDRMLESMKGSDDPVTAALETANRLADEDADMSKKIGQSGLKLIERIGKETVNIMTHCNAGWLAFVDYGTATSPIYAAFEKGIKLHVWVSETRPRNQGTLTAWELTQQGVPHTFISDNEAGHLMRTGQVDMVIVGADRVTANGDVANKIGTYMKALAAKDNDVPFYVAFPHTTIDWTLDSGDKIPIEERHEDEVRTVRGSSDGKVIDIELTGSKAVNYAFDVTPARLITGFITERCVCKPSELSRSHDG